MCERQGALHISFWRDALPSYDKQQQQRQDLELELELELGLVPNWSTMLPAIACCPSPFGLALFACARRVDG